MFFLYYFLFSFSIVGYGYLLCEILKIRINNFGLIGLTGIFFLTLISLFTSLFIAHDYIFNLIVLITGLILFIRFISQFQYKKNEILVFLLVFSFLIIFVLNGKNHDDFPYYHFPYTYMLTQESHPIGLGQINNGFRNPSSLFFFNSLLYFPKTDIYLIHLGSVYFLGFANIFLLKNIYDKSFFKKNKFYNFINLIFFIYLNTLFVRLSEYGTDRGGQILIIIIFMVIIFMINNKKDYEKNSDYLKFIFIIASLVISLKPFYLIYFPALLIFLFYRDLNKIFLEVLKSRTFVITLIFCFFTFFYTFLNSSCLVFPASFTCFDHLSWSIPKKEIDEVRVWYELWSKAGATPNYTVDSKITYIENFNWINNWFKSYFFNKVSDYFLVLIFIYLLIYFVFKKKKSLKIYKRDYLYPYLFLFFCLLEWFLNHPSLRYGGYHLLALIIFIPLSFKLEKFEINWNEYIKKITIFILITSLIFISRNVSRLYKEYKIYNYNVFNNINYLFIGGDENFYFRYDNMLTNKKFKYEYKSIFKKKILIIKNSE